MFEQQTTGSIFSILTEPEARAMKGLCAMLSVYAASYLHLSIIPPPETAAPFLN